MMVFVEVLVVGEISLKGFVDSLLGIVSVASSSSLCLAVKRLLAVCENIHCSL